MKLKKYIFVMFPLLLILLAACEKDINIKVPQDDEKIVVEAYVNNLYANLNYVLITRTINYFNPDFSLKGFSNATVTINEGKIIAPGDTVWKIYSLVPSLLLPGYYNNDSLKGIVGDVYKLEIWLNNEYFHSITMIPQVVPIDSLTQKTFYDGNKPYANLSVHFNDPPSPGQNYRAMILDAPDSGFFAWGDIPVNNQAFFNDDNDNGMYQHYTYLRKFEIGDTIHYYLANMDRAVYNFWESFENARRNGGPFATPIQLRSNVTGKNVIGCFSGYAVDYKKIIFKL